MRTPIYNDRGQFRYSDFVGYMPEYLKTEPDVVTLLQVFSDYINNAYRNIDTVEKFEFSVVESSTNVSNAARRMEYLRTMLDLAGTRNDRVNLLSVPRANVKTNVVFGRSTGYSPYTANYSGSKILDRIERPASFIPGIDGFNDGDVIFINYEESDHEVAYYYDKQSNCLVRDPLGTSQDPFTSTDNSSSRIVSFKVSDVSSVKTRYGHTTDNGTRYKEVFFTARIYDVASEQAVKEIDLADGKTAVIDYYDTGRTRDGIMRTTVRFDGESGWKWSNGFPGAIIYLSETSGANLASVSGMATDRVPLNKCTDPSFGGVIGKYPIKGTPVYSDGVVTVKLDGYYPAYSNGNVYIALKRNLEIVGEFTVVRDSRENGTLDLTLIPTGDVPVFDGIGELVLLDVPLFYGKGVLDYGQGSPLIRFNGMHELVRVDEDGLNLRPDASLHSYACDSVGNPSIGTLDIVRRDDPGRKDTDSYMDGGFRVVVPFTSDLARNYGKLYDLGDRIYIDGGHEYWSGLAIVKDFQAVSDGYAIKLEGIDPIRPSGDGNSARIRAAKVGYFTIESGVVDGYVNESLLDESGTPVVLSGNEQTVAAYMYPGGRFDRVIPDGNYTLEIIRRTDDRAHILLQVDIGSDCTTTVWKKSRGDLFTRPYMMLTDSIGNMVIGSVYYPDGEEVSLLAPGDYVAGQYVYDPVSRKVYQCSVDCRVRDINAVSSNSNFIEDRIVHYSVPYTEKFNAFMPYYGPIAAMEYGEHIDYTVDRSTFMSPLYITKIEEHSLKYGWEHREFLNYGDIMNMGGRDRNGMVEFHSTRRTNSETDDVTVDNGMDIVDTDLVERCAWSYAHDVVARGCSPTVDIDIDDPMVLGAERIGDTNKWKVTVHSAAHGLVSGSLVSVSGLDMVTTMGGKIDFNIQFVPVEIVDGDAFTYVIESPSGVQGTKCYAGKGSGRIVYIQDHYAKVLELSFHRETHELSVMFDGKVHGIVPGDSVYLDGCKDNVGKDVPCEVISVNDDYTGISIYWEQETAPVLEENAIVRKPIHEGDVVMVTDSNDKPIRFYEVSSGIWEQVDRDALITPLNLFSQMNLFDVSETNPAMAFGDPIVIDEIICHGEGRTTATVHLKKALPHFTEENRKYIEGKTVVFISNVSPSDFNGLHVVTEINSPTSIEISMDMYNTYTNHGIPVSDMEMTLRECRWYRFIIDEIEWDKVSSQATFTGKNKTTPNGSNQTNGTLPLICEHEHGLRVGDYAVLGYDFSAFDETSGLGSYAMGKVTSVIDSLNVGIEIIYGEYVPGMSINRGVITLPGCDNLVNRNGEYSIRLASIGNEKYTFRDGDIVLAAGQVVNSEQVALLVRSDSQWTVLKKKRVLKIRKICVDEYRNSSYMDGIVEEGMDEYKYATYSDVDVAKAAHWSYASRAFMVRNPLFGRPCIANIDTTRDPNAEYSSGEDFGNIAPRTDMKSSFHGVPDLKYPLIEKIERLAYLRDANVIDFELIGYLARFMGYDLTPMAEDIETSSLYRSMKQREAAIREAVVNLPQYYALGGTKPGLNMLMGAFGVIGDVLTLYTNTMDPYGEMLNRDEVVARLEEDSENGTLSGTWVPTPYIDISLTDDARFPQFAIQPDDIKRIKEQIRVWKPIQVVFRDTLLRYVGEIEMDTWITGPIVGIGEYGTAIAAADDEDVSIEPSYIDESLTNCAF